MLIIDQIILNEMKAAVMSCSEECCGFFFGYEKPKGKTIMKMMIVSNATQGDKRANFEISAYDYLLSERVAIQENMSLLGVYHSHINYPAVPSQYDLQAAQPCFSYIIISIIDQKFKGVKSWQMDHTFQFKEEKIRLVKSI